VTITEFVYSAGDPAFRRYVSEMADAVGDEQMEADVWTRLSLLPGDADKGYLARSAAEIVLSKASRGERRKVKRVVEKFISDAW
jgi:hypothetical protein